MVFFRRPRCRSDADVDMHVSSAAKNAEPPSIFSNPQIMDQVMTMNPQPGGMDQDASDVTKRTVLSDDVHRPPFFTPMGGLD